MNSYVIKNATLVNEGQQSQADVYIKNQSIETIAPQINITGAIEIDATGKYLFPGFIDDQVHFREPGLTHKAEIYTEAKAAVAGGITSFMEMPNTVPNTLTQDLLADKYAIGAKKSLANFSFFMGASNNNLDEVLKTDIQNVCGIKVFMGSSTGNMLVDNPSTLEGIFANAPTLVATHCEDEATIQNNLQQFKALHGDKLTIDMHPLIRNEEACYLSSSFAVNLAKKYGTRLHILHISTGKETFLFDNQTPLKDKKITSEACIHHLWFNNQDYATKGNFIKWNPAVKTQNDQEQILKAVLDNHIDVIATDHAPHTLEEKSKEYSSAPAGGPLVQHAFNALFQMYHQGKISLEKIAEKTSHSLAICFKIKDRGFIREGYYADLTLVDLNSSYTVTKENILSKSKNSAFLQQKTKGKVYGIYNNKKLIINNLQS